MFEQVVRVKKMEGKVTLDLYTYAELAKYKEAAESEKQIVLGIINLGGHNNFMFDSRLISENEVIEQLTEDISNLHKKIDEKNNEINSLIDKFRKYSVIRFIIFQITGRLKK